MTVLQKRIAGIGLSKQSAKGVAGVSPATYGLGVRSGSILRVEIDQESDSISFSSRISGDENRLGVNPGAACVTRAWPKSVGLLLYAALGGDSVSGSGPYTHAITPASDLPYLTVFTQLDTEYHSIADCKVNRLSITWNEREPLEVEMELAGITWTGYTAAWSATNDENGQSRFIPPGGIFKVDTSSTTPAVAAITGGTITINNNLVAVPLSVSTLPDDQAVAMQEIEYSLNLMPSSSVEWRKILTGAAGGTSAVGTPVYGSADCKFTIDASNDLQIASTRIGFLADYPEMDPSGGPAELTLNGRVKKPTGAAMTATVINSVASY
jgi:hypothetical protein